MARHAQTIPGIGTAGPVLYEDPWITIDQVPAHTASGAEYLHRKIWSSDGLGSIIVPFTQFRGLAHIGMVAQPRPAISLPSSLEFPRGRTIDLESGEAVRELAEETGLDVFPDGMRLLGVLHPDTGVLATTVAVWSVAVPWSDAMATSGRVEEESGAVVEWLPAGGWLGMVYSGQITRGMTLAAYTLALSHGIFTPR